MVRNEWIWNLFYMWSLQSLLIEWLWDVKQRGVKVSLNVFVLSKWRQVMLLPDMDSRGSTRLKGWETIPFWTCWWWAPKWRLDWQLDKWVESSEKSLAGNTKCGTIIMWQHKELDRIPEEASVGGEEGQDWMLGNWSMDTLGGGPWS